MSFQLCFLAHLPALGFRRYHLGFSDPSASKDWNDGEVKLSYKGSVKLSRAGLKAEKIKSTKKSSTLRVLSNDKVSISVHPKTGFLQSIRHASPPGSAPLRLDLSFVSYGVRPIGTNVINGSHTTSGAYLFLPDGPAIPLKSSGNNSYVIVDGPVQKTLMVKFSEPYHLLHIIELNANSDSPSIRNLVDLSNHLDIEVAMRLKTETLMREFYTELNAYQFIRRQRHHDKLPLQAHFFPMPGTAFIQSGDRRLSLLGRQALGVASLEAGWMEVVLDRRLTADDQRGLEQGVLDTRITESRFQLVLEDFSKTSTNKQGMKTEGNVERVEDKATTAYHSLHAYHTSLQLHYPTVVQFISTTSATSNTPLKKKGLSTDEAANPENLKSPVELSLVKSPLPCNIHLVALRTLNEKTNYTDKFPGNGQLVSFPSLETKAKSAAALILHKVAVECGLDSPLATTNCETGPSGPIPVDSIFVIKPKVVSSASLTLLEVKEGEDVKQLDLNPMEIKSWQVEF